MKEALKLIPYKSVIALIIAHFSFTPQKTFLFGRKSVIQYA